MPAAKLSGIFVNKIKITTSGPWFAPSRGPEAEEQAGAGRFPQSGFGEFQS